MNPPTAQLRNRRVDFLLVSVVAIFALFLGVNGVMLWITLRQPPQLVAHGSDEGVGSPDTNDPSIADSGPMWTVKLQSSGPSGRLSIHIDDSNGRPLAGVTGSVYAYRPSDSSLDQKLAVQELPGATGSYKVDFSTSRTGLWKLIFELQRGSDKVRRTISWSAP